MSVGGALVLLLGGVVAQAAPPAAGGSPSDGAAPAAAAPTGAAEPSADTGAETVVTATTPLHGSRLPRERVPANVQTVTADAIAARHSLDLTDYMLDALGSVSGNQVQQNPLQPDFQYRGFLASPLLGAPQGLSVYIDGVRLNEPFGDTLSWDLIPTEAVRSANLMPGSNPLYGLNTLGGALSLETKTGFSDPGAEVHLLGGSFGRRLLDVGIGGHGEHWGVFAAGRYFGEDGWRPFSPSRTASAFLATTYQNGATTAELSLARRGHHALRQRPGAARSAAARPAADLHPPGHHRQPDVHGDRARRAAGVGARAPVRPRLLPGDPDRDGQRRPGGMARLPGPGADGAHLRGRRRGRRDAGARRRRQPDPVRRQQPLRRLRERDAHAPARHRRRRPARDRSAAREPREPPVRRRRRQRGAGDLHGRQRAGAPVGRPGHDSRAASSTRRRGSRSTA